MFLKNKGTLGYICSCMLQHS